MEFDMPNEQDFEAMLPGLPLSVRLALHYRLEDGSNESLAISHAAMEQADFALIEQRLDDYDAGRLQASTWEMVETRIRQQIDL